MPAFASIVTGLSVFAATWRWWSFATRRCDLRCRSERASVRSNGVFAGFNGLVENREEFVFVEHHLLASKAREVIDAGEFDRIDRARFFAHPAVNASKLIDSEGRWEFVAIFPMGIIFGRGSRNDFDAVGGACSLAHVTCHALNSALFIAIEPMDPAIIGRDFRFDFGILTGHRFSGNGVPNRSGKPGNDGWQIEGIEHPEFRFLAPFNGFCLFVTHTTLLAISRERSAPSSILPSTH